MLTRRQTIAGLAAGGVAAHSIGVSADPAAGEWQSLFNGRDLDGWTIFQQEVGARDAHHAVTVENGMLHFLGARFDGPGATCFGRMTTTDRFQDYHLQVDYKWGEKRYAPRHLQRRNSGILYHMGPEEDRLFPDCIEFQVEEGDVGDAITVNTRALAGPLLGGTPLWPDWIPAIPRNYEEPTHAGGIARQWFHHAGPYENLDSWNRLDLIAFGDQAAHLVNGRIVLTLFGMSASQGASGANVAPSPLTGGRIALEFEAAEIWFRNVRIRKLDSAAIAEVKRG